MAQSRAKGMRAILRTGLARRLAPLSLAAFVALAALLALSVLAGGATAQPPSSGNGAARFDDLRELNNKLRRAIASFGLPDRHAGQIGFTFPGTDRLRHTLSDLEATKLRAVDQFPSVFGKPYSQTFVQLSCIDEKIAIGQVTLNQLQSGHLKKHYGQDLERELLRAAKACKDTLESELGSSVPSGISSDLRELNNKLVRAITAFGRTDRHAGQIGFTFPGIDRLRHILTDLEATKLRAVDQFPEVFDPPYVDTFTRLSCIDEKIAIGQITLKQLQSGHLKKHYGQDLERELLRAAKACKDTLEVELMHSFNLKPSEQSEVGVNPTTPNGTDTQNPNKLNAPKTLKVAYKRDGFIARHEQDYFANGINSSNPDSWPSGRNVLFFDVFDLFGSTSGAQKAETASIQNLKSSGFTPISDSSLGPGEAVFQHQAAGSSLLSTIIYLQRGTFIMKIAGACNGCSRGSVESTLESEAQTQLNRAVIMGFPAASSTASHIPEEFQTSGNAPVYAFGQPGYHLCLYLHGPAGQTGNVKVEPGDSTSQSDPNAQTSNQAFTLDSNGTAFFSFNEPAELFKITINRLEADGSTNTTTTSAETRIHNPPPWGLPDCT